MANTTLASLRALTRTNIKVDPNAKIINDEAMNEFINIGLDQVQQEFNYALRYNKATATAANTVNGTQEYSLPSDFIRVDLLKVGTTNTDETERVDILRDNNSFPSGVPRDYYLTDDSYGLHPIPDSTLAIQLEYIKILPTLSDDSDTSGLPPDFDDAIVKFAAHLAFSTIPRYRQDAEEKLLDFKRAISKLRYRHIVRSNMSSIIKGRRAGLVNNQGFKII